MNDAKVKLRELGIDIEILQGFAFSSGHFSEKDGLPLVRIRDLGSGITETRYSGPYSDEYVINLGDVLIGMDGDFKVVRWSGERALLNQRVCRVRSCTSAVDDGFLFHAIQPEIERIHRLTPQTTVRHLGSDEIRACTVLDVALDEQQRIAEILDTIDDAIQATERVIAKLGDLQDGLVQCYPLEGGLAHETVSRDLPDGWRYLTLEEITVNHDGRRVPIRAEDRQGRSGSYPYYGASGVIDHIDGYLFDGTFVLLGEDGENVLSRSTPLAFVAKGRIWVNNHAHVFEARSGVDSRFLARVLERTDYTSIVSGSAQPKITQFGLRQMRFPMPSQEVQKKLCDELEIVDNRIASEIHHAAGLTAVRTGLAADLLSGRVRTVAA